MSSGIIRHLKRNTITCRTRWDAFQKELPRFLLSCSKHSNYERLFLYLVIIYIWKNILTSSMPKMKFYYFFGSSRQRPWVQWVDRRSSAGQHDTRPPRCQLAWCPRLLRLKVKYPRIKTAAFSLDLIYADTVLEITLDSSGAVAFCLLFSIVYAQDFPCCVMLAESLDWFSLYFISHY